MLLVWTVVARVAREVGAGAERVVIRDWRVVLMERRAESSVFRAVFGEGGGDVGWGEDGDGEGEWVSWWWWWWW